LYESCSDAELLETLYARMQECLQQAESRRSGCATATAEGPLPTRP